ncbi:MAG: hypothetical protein RLZZ175_2632 [Bacteroidota bacterium]|jgi:hypothetical protein
MGKRLIRIKQKDIVTKQSSWQNTELNLVFASGEVMFGFGSLKNNETIILVDKKQKSHSFKLSTISEIVRDEKSDF